MTKFYKLTRTGPTEHEFSIADWRLRGVRHKLRIGVQNESEFYVVMPGKGGHFRLSYSYQFALPLRGSGPATIRKKVTNPQNSMRDFRAAELMIEQTVLGIDEARRKLMKERS